MSKESIRASIAAKRAEIARIRTAIAQDRSRKKDASARYAALIKNASSASSKANYRSQKVTVITGIEASIRSKMSVIASKQRDIESLNRQLKSLSR